MSKLKNVIAIPRISTNLFGVADTDRLVAPVDNGQASEPCTRSARLWKMGPSEPAQSLVEWLRRIQAWRGHVPETEITALLDTLQIPERFNSRAQEAFVAQTANGDSGCDQKKVAKVCVGLACALAGSEELCQSLQIEGYGVTRETCLGRCWSSPAAIIGDQAVSGNAWTPSTPPLGPEEVRESARHSLQAYMDAGGYSVLKSCLTRRRSIESVQAEWSTHAMATFESATPPLGVRIKILCASLTPPKLLIILDATGAMASKNSFYLEHNRHAVLEGLLITARATGAHEIIVHGSAHQAFEVKRLKAAIAALAETYLDQHVRFTFTEPDGGDRCLVQHLFAGSLQREAQSPLPYGDMRALSVSPILILEPSLLRWLPEMLSKGAHWLSGLACGEDRPPNLYLICGRVRTPGVYLAASGSTVWDLIQIAGGIEPGHTFESFVAGDWSNPALPSRLATVRLDSRSGTEPRTHREVIPSMTGSVVVISTRDSTSRQCVFTADVSAACAPDPASEIGEDDP